MPGGIDMAMNEVRAALMRAAAARPAAARSGTARSGEPAAGRGPDTSTFLRGLVVGALVGAAIPGSTIWERRPRVLVGAGVEGADDAEPVDPTR